MIGRSVKPVIPYLAPNFLSSRNSPSGPLKVLAVLLILIELVIFTAPKVIWLFSPSAQWASLKLLRKQVTSFLWPDLIFVITASFISGEAHTGGLIFGFLAGPFFLGSPRAHRNALKLSARNPILPASSKETAS